MSYTVTQPTHEIGIRVALAADRRNVFKLVAGQGMRLIAVGMLLGLFSAYLLTRWLDR